MPKTIHDFTSDSYERAKNENLQISQLDDEHYYVFNNSHNSYYVVTVDNDSQRIIECSCPHYFHRLQYVQVPCKHIIKLTEYLGYEYY